MRAGAGEEGTVSVFAELVERDFLAERVGLLETVLDVLLLCGSRDDERVARGMLSECVGVCVKTVEQDAVLMNVTG